jgi:hypothetical protein
MMKAMRFLWILSAPLVSGQVVAVFTGIPPFSQQAFLLPFQVLRIPVFLVAALFELIFVGAYLNPNVS